MPQVIFSPEAAQTWQCVAMPCQLLASQLALAHTQTDWTGLQPMRDWLHLRVHVNPGEDALTSMNNRIDTLLSHRDERTPAGDLHLKHSPMLPHCQVPSSTPRVRRSLSDLTLLPKLHLKRVVTHSSCKAVWRLFHPFSWSIEPTNSAFVWVWPQWYQLQVYALLCFQTGLCWKPASAFIRGISLLFIVKTKLNVNFSGSFKTFPYPTLPELSERIPLPEELCSFLHYSKLTLWSNITFQEQKKKLHLEADQNYKHRFYFLIYLWQTIISLKCWLVINESFPVMKVYSM